MDGNCTIRNTVPQIVKLLINIACLIFVLYQAQKCVKKYLETLQTVDVSIEKASKHHYPELTFCPKGTEVVIQKLRQCNLTYSGYFYNYDWKGNCTDPQDTAEKITTFPVDFFEGVTIDTDDFPMNLNMEDDQHFEAKDTLRFGRCFTFNYPENEDIPEISFMLKNYSFNVYVHSPGSFFGADAQNILIEPGFTVKTTIAHELFDVLGFDGEACNYYESGRDDCIDSAIHKVAMKNG